MYFSRYHTAVFVHGCFWHRHEGCRYAYIPKSRVEFWQKKFEANVRRDAVVREELATMKIRQLIIWECTIRRMMRDRDVEKSVIENITLFLQGSSGFEEM